MCLISITDKIILSTKTTLHLFHVHQGSLYKEPKPWWTWKRYNDVFLKVLLRGISLIYMFKHVDLSMGFLSIMLEQERKKLYQYFLALSSGEHTQHSELINTNTIWKQFLFWILLFSWLQHPIIFKQLSKHMKQDWHKLFISIKVKNQQLIYIKMNFT